MGLKKDIELIRRERGLGIQVRRPAAADPQNVWLTLFTVTGGIIILTALVGVRTIIQAAGAATMQFRHGATVLDSGALAVTGQAAGTIYALSGHIPDPIIAGAAGIPIEVGKLIAAVAQYSALFGAGLIMGAGNIQVTMTAAAGTGSTRYILCYIPLDEEANVVAA